MRKVWIKSGTGKQIRAAVYTPGTPGKALPAVILVNGLLGTKESPVAIPLAGVLLKSRMNVVAFDPTGFGQSEGDFEKDYRFSNILQDLEAVHSFLKRQEFVDRSRIGIFGQSMGGALAIIFAAKHSDIRAVCAVSAPAQMGKTDNLKGIGLEKKFFVVKTKNLGEVKISVDFLLDARKFRTLDYVTRLRVPVFVVWGTKDEIVPMEQTREIFDAVREPKEYLEVLGMGHKYYRDNPKVLRLVNNKVTEFFEKKL